MSLPAFDAPPVVETVIGVEFAPIEGWSIPHYGLYWNEIKDEYPRYEVQPELDSRIERFGQEVKQAGGVRVELRTVPHVRCWFHDASSTRLIQVQRDRLIHNWRGSGDYPRYANIRPLFEREWQRFCGFTSANDMGRPRITQCEVTYVNHIVRGNGWTSLDQVSDVVTFCRPPGGALLPAPDALAAKQSFVLPDQRSRLHVELQHAIRNTDLAEVLQLSLSVRGHPEGNSDEDILAWLDYGHEWVVKSFAEVTSTKMHTLWKRSA